MRFDLHQATRNARSAMTLIELLVVIVLVTTLVSTAIPIISPGGEDRKLREGSRNLNAYLQGAQARAIETGRPYGVAFERLSAETDRGADNAVCTRVEQVEVPALYTGFDDSSLARVCLHDVPNSNVKRLALQFVRHGTQVNQAGDRLPPGFDIDLVPDRFLRPGDTVVVNGAAFVLQSFAVTGANFALSSVAPFARQYGVAEEGAGYFNTTVPTVFFGIEPAAGSLPDLRYSYDSLGNPLPSPERIVPPGDNRYAFLAQAPAPYEVHRQPVPAGGEPLELPNGIAIDLQASVFGSGTRVYAPHVDFDDSSDQFVTREEPFMVLFSPEGSIHRVHGVVASSGAEAGQTLLPSRATSFLALCVGRRELIPAEPGIFNPTDRSFEPIGAPTANDYIAPIDLNTLTTLDENAVKEVTDQYNWLNLESRWVVVGAQSGAISTVDNSSAFPSVATATIEGQLRAALDGVWQRSRAGGR